jgi:flagellar basal-body rod protein FlgF
VAGVIEIGGEIISRASRRMEASAQNIANITTPGYRAQRLFEDLVNFDAIDAIKSGTVVKTALDLTNGKLINTGNPFDLALGGSGFFVVHSADGTFYTRDGQFSRDRDGRLVMANGMALQSESGDIVVNSDDVTVTSDGVILDAGQPIARIAIVGTQDSTALESLGGGLFRTDVGNMQPVNSPQVHQRMVEASNVSTADEMIALMAALRSAESGQKVVQAYDDLIGQALTAFGQN